MNLSSGCIKSWLISTGSYWEVLSENLKLDEFQNLETKNHKLISF